MAEELAQLRTKDPRNTVPAQGPAIGCRMRHLERLPMRVSCGDLDRCSSSSDAGRPPRVHISDGGVAGNSAVYALPDESGDEAEPDGGDPDAQDLDVDGADSQFTGGSQVVGMEYDGEPMMVEGLGLGGLATQREMSLTSLASRVEAEDYYESIYDLTRAFHVLCAKSGDRITAQDLVKMSADQKGLDPSDPSMEELRPRVVATLRALNRYLDVRVGSRKEPAMDIKLDTFIAIMQRKEVHDQSFCTAVGDLGLDAIAEIRDILVREDTLRKVAKATNMSYGDIYQASHPTMKRGRMDFVLEYIDPFIGLVIMLNAIEIGLSTDIEEDSQTWQWFELSFTVIFVAELLIKLAAFGTSLFIGHDRWWNLFDTLVVAIAVMDAFFMLVGKMMNLRNLTIIRLLRFARLSKLVRVLKLKVFKELALLVTGILAGFRTLIWAMVFLGFVLFAIGVLLAQSVGKVDAAYWSDICIGVEGAEAERTCTKSAEHIQKYRKELFGNVPRSMFTVFRCFTDGCASVDGTPLTPYFFNTHGIVVIIFYMIVTLFVIFGLFNLIMAVFVENTIENAKHDDARRREARAGEDLRVAKKLQEVIIMFYTAHGDNTKFEELRVGHTRAGGSQSWFRKIFSVNLLRDSRDFGEQVDPRHLQPQISMHNLSLKVTHEKFIRMLQSPNVQQMLDDLDIGASSRRQLFEVLDANQNGTLEVGELVQGLLKLRGTAEKADVIASLLAIRSVQKSIRAMEVLSLHQQETIAEISEAQIRAEETLDELMRRPAGAGGGGQRMYVSLKEQRAQTLEKRASTPSLQPGLTIMRADAERRAKMPIDEASRRRRMTPSAVHCQA